MNPDVLTEEPGVPQDTLESSPAAAEPAPARCPSCGAPAMLEYCARCGERRMEPGAYRMVRFAREALEQVSSLDSRLIRSLDSLGRPGWPTREHLSGRRRPHLPPLQLFLLANLLFFFVNSLTGSQPFTTSFPNQVHHQPYSPLIHDWAEARAESHEAGVVGYARDYTRTTRLQARSLVGLMVPLFALLSFGLLRRRRRYLAEHLVFSLHFYAFFLITLAVIDAGATLVARWLAARGGSSEDLGENVLMFLIVGCLSLYFWRALPAAFGVRGPTRGLATAALVTGVIGVLFAYRFILFFTTVAVT
jgi:hypothetical protein